MLFKNTNHKILPGMMKTTNKLEMLESNYPRLLEFCVENKMATGTFTLTSTSTLPLACWSDKGDQRRDSVK